MRKHIKSKIIGVYTGIKIAKTTLKNDENQFFSQQKNWKIFENFLIFIFKMYSKISDDAEFTTCEIDEVLESFLVFVAVPIRSFEGVIKEIS